MSRCAEVMVRLLRADVDRLRHVFNHGEDFALFDMVAFFDIQVGDWAECGGPNIDIIFGLDLSGSADDAGKILSRDLGRQNFLGIGVAAINGNCNQSGTASTMPQRLQPSSYSFSFGRSLLLALQARHNQNFTAQIPQPLPCLTYDKAGDRVPKLSMTGFARSR